MRDAGWGMRKVDGPDTHLASRISHLASRLYASRTASPSSVHATTTSTSATPGAVATQGALTTTSRPEAIMLPHDGVGGWTPRPRNERPASSMIALPTPSAAATLTGVSAFGR